MPARPLRRRPSRRPQEQDQPGPYRSLLLCGGIPYPYAASNHQRINAKCLYDEGACVYIEDSELEPNKLKEAILEIVGNPLKMNYLKQNTSRLAKFDATDKIVTMVKRIRK